MAEIAKIVQGNNFNVAIPLKVYILNEGEVVLQAYTPAEGDDVTIRLVGERRGYTYKPTIEGNVAHLQLSGHEVCDTYAVEVVIISTDGTMLRSYRGDQLAIVYNVDTIIADGAVEDGELYLDSQFFIQGQKGEQGDPGQDGTDGQDGQDGQDGADGRGIVSITKTATAGLVDTYTITYTDGTTSTFEVTNGKDGSGGGGEDFIVNVTRSGGVYVADKTLQECITAFGQGLRVVFTKSGGTGIVEYYIAVRRLSTFYGGQYYRSMWAFGVNGSSVQILKYDDSGITLSLTPAVIDNTTSDSTTAALSANQGRKLQGLVDGKANTADLAAVATSGNYNDLNNKPSIPAAQVNADWNAASGVAQILNKPTIPTKTSDLTNDSNFVDAVAMAAALSGKQDVTAIETMPSGAIAPADGYEPNKMYDFGKVASVTFATYDTSKEIANAVNLYMFTFQVASGGTTLRLNANIKYPNGDDGTELTDLLTTEDRVFEITIRDNKLSYLYFD